MAQQFISDSADSIPVANGGVALSMGASTGLLSARTPQTPDLGVHGSVVVEGVETAKAVGAGEFSHNHQRPLGFKITEELASILTPALKTTQNSAAWFTQSATSTAYVRQTSTAFRNGDFNIVTGKFRVPPTVVQQCMYSINSGAPNCVANDTDDSTHTTASRPGTLTFMLGSNTASTQNYKPRTQW